MNPYKETFETWNKLSKLYQEKFMDFDLYNDTYNYFCERVNVENPQVLEIGCGPGNITRYLLSKRPDFKITGIDVSPNMLNLAKKNNPTAKFKVMDVRNLRPKNKFDAIISGFCLPYLSDEDSGKLIANCSNLLIPKGIFYFSFVEGDPENSGFQTGSTGDRVFFYYHNLDRLKNILKENNFTNIEIFKKDFVKAGGSKETHCIVLARKKHF